MKKNIITKTQITTTLCISDKDIRQAFQLPNNAEISVKVPSGGDYSGVVLEVGVDIPEIVCKWTETTSKD